MILTHKLISNLRIKCAVQKSWVLLPPPQMAIQLLKNPTALSVLFIGKKIVERIMFPPTLIFQQSFFMCLNEGL